MDLIQQLTSLEDKYIDIIDDEREAAIAEIAALHQSVIEETPEELDRFMMLSADVLGGIYLPYLFWYKLGEYYDGDEDARIYLQELIKIFSESSFEEAEQKKIKSLLLAYFSKEKEFEIDKIRTLIIDKSHTTIKEYFYKLFNFVEKNKSATTMYCDKFTMLKDYQPNFELLAMPISKLKEIL